MTSFTPNLFGKVVFVLICGLEYLYVVCPITRFFSTKWLLFDMLIWFTVMIICGYVTALFIWKLLNLYK